MSNDKLNTLEEPEDEEDIDARSQFTANAIANNEQFLLEVECEQTETLIEKVGVVREKERRDGVSMLTKVPTSSSLLVC